MQWWKYVLKQMLAPDPTPIPVASEELSHLVWLERKIALHRFLRGIMVYFALLSITVSLFEFKSLLGNLIVHFALSFLSLSGVGCVIAIYKAEIVFRGMPNPAFPKLSTLKRTKSTREKLGTPRLKMYHFSVFQSPSFGVMMVEIVVWLIHSPVGILGVEWENLLTSLVFLRTYVIILYFYERWSSSLYSRSINVIRGFPHSFPVDYKQSHFSKKWVWLSLIFIIFFLLIGLYRQLEDISWGNACLFSASTVLSWGFGGMVPTTTGGQIVSFFLWMLGLLFLVWMIRSWVDYLELSDSTTKMYNLLKIYRSRCRIRVDAAKTIQRAWNLYVHKRRKSFRLTVHCCALLLTRQCFIFRETRRQAKLTSTVHYSRRNLHAKQKGDVWRSTVSDSSSKEQTLNLSLCRKKSDGKGGSCDRPEPSRTVEDELDSLILRLQEVIESKKRS